MPDAGFNRRAFSLLLAALAVVGVTLWLPYSPAAALLGFAPLPLPCLMPLCAIVGLDFATAELAKRCFYRRTAKTS